MMEVTIRTKFNIMINLTRVIISCSLLLNISSCHGIPQKRISDMDRWKDKSYTLQVPEIEVCSPELIKTIDSFLNDIKAKLDSINWQEDHMPVITLAISEEGNVLKKSLDADSNYAQIFEGASEDPRMTMFPTYGAFHEKGFQIRVSLTQPNLICKNCVPKGKEICPISYTSDSLELIVYEFQDRKGVVLYDNQFYFLRTI